MRISVSGASAEGRRTVTLAFDPWTLQPAEMRKERAHHFWIPPGVKVEAIDEFFGVNSGERAEASIELDVVEGTAVGYQLWRSSPHKEVAASFEGASYHDILDFSTAAWTKFRVPQTHQAVGASATAHFGLELVVSGGADSAWAEAGARSLAADVEDPGNGEPPPPPPPPTDAGVLTVLGNQFAVDGQVRKLLGASTAGSGPDGDHGKAAWWPFASQAFLDSLKARSLNFVHIRLGPFTVFGEGSIDYAAYKLVGGKYDLTQWEPNFWGRARTVCFWAQERGIFAEVDLVDRWIRDHGRDSDTPQLDPWRASQNIQGGEHGTLSIFQHAPNITHELFIREAVRQLSEFPNVIFQDGNEGFKGFSAQWCFGLRDIVRSELDLLGRSRLVGSNTMNPTIESGFDYATRHQKTVPSESSRPIMITEYAALPPATIIQNAAAAHAQKGTHFHAWLDGLSGSQRTQVLDGLGAVASGGTLPPPPPDQRVCTVQDLQRVTRIGLSGHSLIDQGGQLVNFGWTTGSTSKTPHMRVGWKLVVDSTYRVGSGNGTPLHNECDDENFPKRWSTNMPGAHNFEGHMATLKPAATGSFELTAENPTNGVAESMPVKVV